MSDMDTNNTPQSVWFSVWYWSELYPDYDERMAAMSHPANIANAFEDASFLSLVPLE